MYKFESTREWSSDAPKASDKQIQWCHDNLGKMTMAAMGKVIGIGHCAILKRLFSLAKKGGFVNTKEEFKAYLKKKREEGEAEKKQAEALLQAF